jgi:GT2 family glycosyltransferase
VKVSFIIPLYNCLPLTQAMLESLQATLPPNLPHEIVLVDDGSTDGTRDWLDTLHGEAFKVLLNERNLGYAASNNRAVKAATGDVLVLLNNDLVLMPSWYAALRRVHARLGARAGLVGNVQINARTGEIDHTGIVLTLKAKPEHDRTLAPGPLQKLRGHRVVPAVTAACVMIDAALWRQLGGFDEGYVNGGEDVDLCFRAAAAGRLNAVALESVVRHHISASPGRKLRDEANSARLMRTWRHEFVRGACRQWCRDYAGTILQNPRDYSPSLAARVAAYAAGLAPSPPAEAEAALNACLDLEDVRWRSMGV